MIDIIPRAEIYATAAHAAVGQIRKYTNLPYIMHPAAVANLVAQANGTPEMIAAAWLHDVVEDTKCTSENIRTEFGPTVATYVDWMTDKTTKEDGNRASRKEKDRLRWAKAPPQAKTIKLADLIDNTSSIAEFDPEFAKVYMAEKEKLVWALKEGDHKLLCRAMQQIQEYQQATLEKSLGEMSGGGFIRS